jgi:uncharacterized membrane protein HdeD (DUF308 family)
MTDTATQRRIPRGWLYGYAAASIIVGILALIWPLSATITAAFLFGWLLVISGVASIVTGFGHRGHHIQTYRLIYGVVTVIVGFLILLEPVAGALSLTMLVTAWLAIRGVLEIMWGVRDTRDRWPLLALGVVNLLLAIWVLATLPWTALTLPGFLLAISFIAAGVEALVTARRRSA